MYEILLEIDKKEQKIKDIYVDKQGEFKHKIFEERNTIIKETEQGELELIYYKEPFLIPKIKAVEEKHLDFINKQKETIIYREVDKKRNFKLKKDIIFPVTNKATLQGLIKNLKSGDKRNTKLFYDYAFNNRWDYFTTFTFAKEEERFDRQKLKKAWSIFSYELKKISPEVKILCVVEQHEKGGYHLHVLISDIDLLLVPARNNNKESKYYQKFMYTKYNDQIFNLNLWKNGYSQVVPIDHKDNQKKVAHYISKYIRKTPVALYGEKRFYKTQNLVARKTEIANLCEIQKLACLNKFNLKLKKTDGNVEYYETKSKKSCQKSCQPVEEKKKSDIRFFDM